MNTEELVEMIDAIDDGRPFVNSWESELEGDSLLLATSPQKVTLTDVDGNFAFQCKESRTAREIACALIVWADRKDGRGSAISFQSAVYVALKKISDAANENSVWREEWYSRNVNKMTLETKRRNLKDLVGILAHTTNETERKDIHAAIQIIEKSISLHDTPSNAPSNSTE